MNDDPMIPPHTISTNTKVSVALMLVILFAAFWVRDSVGSAGTQVTMAKLEITSRIDKSDQKIDDLSKRVDKAEANRETWSYQDMFKWAVHLQRDNASLKVPEPEGGNAK